ncbi:MAG: TIGR03621 family F420-dependent LLM class oxidoreductase [Acidimicrobiia bacterium]|nr:TIGR03621 family F420-dependent LLM class oxidoreductase [Acidimicrobiia bacterium]
MAAQRRFRFGIHATKGGSADGWREKARRTEALGYSTLVMPDHHVGTELDPMVAIAVAAGATEALRVGTLVLGNDFRHPVVLAKEAATVDLLSEGRLELGLGAGWMRGDYAALGLPCDPPGVRVERLAEALAVVKGCWGDGPFSFEGEHYRVADLDAAPKPVQQPPPILVGGGGERVLALAAREADIVGVNPNLAAGDVSPEMARDTVASMTRKKVEWVREAAGDRWDEIELQVRYFFCAVTDDRVGLAEQVAPAFGLTPEEALESGIALVGTVEEMVEQLQARREEYGFSYVVVDEDVMEDFAPVVERLAGT